MNKLLTALIALTLSTPVLAKSTREEIESFTRTVMTHRQNDTPLVKMMGVVKDSPQAIQDIVTNAYSEIKYSTQSFKDNKINEFANMYYLACLKEIKKTP